MTDMEKLIDSDFLQKLSEEERQEVEQFVGCSFSRLVCANFHSADSQTAQQDMITDFQYAIKQMELKFGASSDALHYFYLESIDSLAQQSFAQGQNFFGQNFIEHVQQKFSDTSRVENLEAQIHYYTEQIRRESSIHDHVAALALMPKLVQLMNARMQMAEKDDSESFNLYKFRKAIVLQDMAQLKVALGKPEDTVYHLVESEKLLRESKTYSDVGIGKLVVRAAFERNNDLNMKARAL